MISALQTRLTNARRRIHTTPLWSSLQALLGVCHVPGAYTPGILLNSNKTVPIPFLTSVLILVAFLWRSRSTGSGGLARHGNGRQVSGVVHSYSSSLVKHDGQVVLLVLQGSFAFHQTTV